MAHWGKLYPREFSRNKCQGLAINHTQHTIYKATRCLLVTTNWHQLS